MFGERLLLWCVDPDDVQVAVIHTLLVFVSVTCASLYAPPGPRGITGRAGLRYTLRGNLGVIVRPIGQRRSQHDLFHFPLFHISA